MLTKRLHWSFTLPQLKCSGHRDVEQILYFTTDPILDKKLKGSFTLFFFLIYHSSNAHQDVERVFYITIDQMLTTTLKRSFFFSNLYPIRPIS